MITKRYTSYKNFGKCLEISNGEIKALITIDVGPRIIFYGYSGHNMFKEDIDREVSKDGQFFDEHFKYGEKWFLYGGHRIWKSEEDLYSYVPDNYPIRVDRFENGALFTPPVQKATGLQQLLKVTMRDNGCLEIEESLTNTLDTPATLAIWGLSVLRTGGTEFFPKNTTDTGLLPQQNMVFWPYNDKKDRRFAINHKYIVLKQKTKIERAFKVGLYNRYGWAGYNYGKYLLIKKFDVLRGYFPDYQCNFETYTNDKFLEMEVLSPFKTLNKNEIISQKEYFSVYKDICFNGFSDEAIDKVLADINFKG